MSEVATCIVINNERKILILRRSEKVSTYKGKWGGVTGYVEENETPYQTAIKEIEEEIGIMEKDITLLKELEIIEFTDFYEGKKYEWKIYPFLFKIEKKRKIQIDWEHIEYRWISPHKIQNFDTVPHLKDIVSEVL
jgi:8-oxo-dGTP pyrophosphatase MutT (NUDIX family)